ncbi:MAG TPA: hypothetical protein VKA46_38410 [Gemmataceae bacterium]|nr:hypothetical protein [Gemmataceae bacterium]
MRSNSLILAVILCAANAGCGTVWSNTGGTFWVNTVRNTVEAPIYGMDKCYISRRNYYLAQQAWHEVSRTHPGQPFSSDYGKGFIDGYADYLESGGNGQPPAVPPFCYRLSRYQTPQGYQAIEEWYAGFRAGATAAMASGLRQLFILPLSAPPINAVERNPATPAGPVTPSLGSESPPDLPVPRPVRPDDPAPPPEGEPPG